jgi:hypothetical protein
MWPHTIAVIVAGNHNASCTTPATSDAIATPSEFRCCGGGGASVCMLN